MFKTLKPLALAIMATLTLTGTVEGKVSPLGGVKNASLDLQSSVFSNPATLVFEPKNGQYELKEIDGASIVVRLKAEKVRRAWITSYKITFDSQNGPVLADSGWAELHLKKLDKKFTFNLTKDLLKSYVAEGRKYCNEKGNPLKTVLKKTGFLLRATVDSKGKNIFATESALNETAHPQAYVPLSFACLPEPFEVKDVQLSVKYEGVANGCPVKATLQAKFKTNKPEKKKFTFVLVRDNGMKQEVTKYAYPQGNGGVATWQKSYTFTKSDKRKYFIYVKGHKATSPTWVPVKANCDGGPGGKKNGKPSQPTH